MKGLLDSLHGIPEWDWSGPGEWIGQPRTYQELMFSVRQFEPIEKIKANARSIGLIRCDCVWVDGIRVIWVPSCEAHGGGCTHIGCTHRHYSSEGDT